MSLPPPSSAASPLPGQLPPDLWPNVDQLVIGDGAPVDSIYSERQMRLLTEPLYASWKPEDGQDFVALVNVGVFYAIKEPPIVPDMLLSLDVTIPPDHTQKQNNSYFVWVFGKPPDAAFEIVSNREGGEDTTKPKIYAKVGVPYYVIWDPENYLGPEALRVFSLRDKKYEPISGRWLPVLGLGLTLWQGTYQGMEKTWLRWCDQQGNVIPTGEEKASMEEQRAEQEKQRADAAVNRAERLAAKLRESGLEPNGAVNE